LEQSWVINECIITFGYLLIVFLTIVALRSKHVITDKEKANYKHIKLLFFALNTTSNNWGNTWKT